jgi:glycosyltransferase involved in cell wall biosynthesis
MACATPIVATNVEGIPEVVKNYENGILVPPNDSVKLAAAIQYLLDNEETRRKFGKTGRDRVVTLFSSKAVAEKIHQIYTTML